VATKYSNSAWFGDRGVALVRRLADEAAEASYEDHAEENWTVEEVQIEELKPQAQ
jgi:hypothetical protein